MKKSFVFLFICFFIANTFVSQVVRFNLIDTTLVDSSIPNSIIQDSQDNYITVSGFYGTNAVLKKYDKYFNLISEDSTTNYPRSFFAGKLLQKNDSIILVGNTNPGNMAEYLNTNTMVQFYDNELNKLSEFELMNNSEDLIQNVILTKDEH